MASATHPRLTIPSGGYKPWPYVLGIVLGLLISFVWVFAR